MTPEQIRERALEAARKAVNAFYAMVDQPEHEDAQKMADRVFASAYEAAMSAAGYHWECAKEANSKPLPQPPEVK